MFVLSEGASVARYIQIVFRTPFSSIISVCCCTLIMQYGPSALGINLSYVGLSIVFKLFVLTTSGGLSTDTNSFVLKTGISQTRLSFSYLYHFCAAVSRLSKFSLIKAGLARRPICNCLLGRRDPSSHLRASIRHHCDKEISVFPSLQWAKDFHKDTFEGSRCRKHFQCRFRLAPSWLRTHVAK